MHFKIDKFRYTGWVASSWWRDRNKIPPIVIISPEHIMEHGQVAIHYDGYSMSRTRTEETENFIWFHIKWLKPTINCLEFFDDL